MSGNQAVPKPGGRPKFTAEFKEDATSMAIDEDCAIADMARSLGLVEPTLAAGPPTALQLGSRASLGSKLAASRWR